MMSVFFGVVSQLLFMRTETHFMVMDLDIHWGWLNDTTVYMLAKMRGELDVEGFKEVLRRVGESFAVLDGDAILDLRHARWNFDHDDMNAVAAAFVAGDLPMDSKIALV